MSAPFDLTTGLELELLLPDGMGRLDLAAELACALDAQVQIFPFVSKVPMPALAGDEDADAVVALIHAVAEHHQAMLHSVAEDGSAFYLIHRAARLLAEDGSTLLSLVHDNTIAGGERVAEVVTPPFLRDRLSFFRRVIRWLEAVPGVAIPEGGALHVHLDGRPFRAARGLARLVALYARFEGELRRLLETPSNFLAAGPLPAGLSGELDLLAAREASWDEVAGLLSRRVRDRRFGLNLYNLTAGEPEKLTVELKLARATLDAERIEATRELLVVMGAWALGGSPLEGDGLPEVIGLAPEHRAALGR